MSSITPAYYSFLKRGEISMQPIFSYFIRKVQENFTYTVEYPSSNVCLIKFPGYPVSLEISNSNWQYFTAAPEDKKKKIYFVILVKNSNQMECSSEYLGYKISNKKIFDTPANIHLEIIRIQKLLGKSNAQELINEIDLCFDEDLPPIDPTTTLEKDAYLQGKIYSKTLADEFSQNSLKEMIQNVETSKLKLHDLRKERKEKFEQDKAKLEEEELELVAEEELKKKMRPVLGKARRLVYKPRFQKKKFVPEPPPIYQYFYEIEVLRSKEYFVLLKMKNSDCKQNPVFYVGLHNSIYNMVNSWENPGLEVCVFNKALKQVDVPELRLSLRCVSDQDQLKEVLIKLQDHIIDEVIANQFKDEDA